MNSVSPGFVDHSPGGNTSVLRVSHSPMAHSPLARSGGVSGGGGSGATQVNPAASFLSATFRVFSLLLDEEMQGAFNSDSRYVAYVANEKNNESERRKGVSVSKSWGDQRRNDRGRVVQVDPIKPKLKPPGNKRLELKYIHLLSILLQFCFQIQLAPLHRGVAELAAAGAAAANERAEQAERRQGLTLVHLSAQPKPFWSHLPVSPCLIDWGEIMT